MHFVCHLLLALLPEPNFVCLLEAHRSSLLQRAHGTVAYACVRGGYGGNKMLLPNEPAYAPACSIEVLTHRADREGEFRKLRGKGGDACERNVIEAVVDLASQL